MNPDSYESLSLKRINVLPIAKFHVEEALKGVNKKLKRRSGPRNPWSYTVKNSVHIDIFIEFFKAVKYYKTKHGFVASSTKSRNIIKSASIKFVHLGSLKRHLERLGVDTSLLKKSLRDGCEAEGMVSFNQSFS